MKIKIQEIYLSAFSYSYRLILAVTSTIGTFPIDIHFAIVVAGKNCNKQNKEADEPLGVFPPLLLLRLGWVLRSWVITIAIDSCIANKFRRRPRARKERESEGERERREGDAGREAAGGRINEESAAVEAAAQAAVVAAAAAAAAATTTTTAAAAAAAAAAALLLCCCGPSQ